MSTQQNPTFKVQLQRERSITTSFSTQYINSRVANVTFSVSIEGQAPVQQQFQIEMNQMHSIGLELVKGTLTMSPQSAISFTGYIETADGQFSIDDVIIGSFVSPR